MKILKVVFALLGISVISGIIIKERNTLNDLRKRLLEIRFFEQEKNK